MDNVAEEWMAELPDGRLVLTPTVLSRLTRLRQVLISPELIGANQPSAAIEAVQDWAKDIKETGQTAVIFTQFTGAIPVLERVLSAYKLRTTAIVGGMTAEAIGQAANAIQSGEADILLASIGVAEGYTVTRASQALVIGPAWNTTENEQAEDRLHRFGQTNEVTITYLMYPGTVDDQVMAILDGKLSLAKPVLDARQFVGL